MYLQDTEGGAWCNSSIPHLVAQVSLLRWISASGQGVKRLVLLSHLQNGNFIPATLHEDFTDMQKSLLLYPQLPDPHLHPVLI